jgi:glycyl-tRNA synthetase
VHELADGKKTWEEIEKELPIFEGQELEMR